MRSLEISADNIISQALKEFSNAGSCSKKSFGSDAENIFSESSLSDFVLKMVNKPRAGRGILPGNSLRSCQMSYF